MEQVRKNKLNTICVLETTIYQILTMKNDSTYVFGHEKKEDIKRKIVISAIYESEKEISLDFRVVMTAGIPATEPNEEIHNGCNKK